MVGLMGLGLGLTPKASADVFVGEFNPVSPLSWQQGNAPYSNYAFAYCGEGSMGYCSCGIHSMAYLLLKSEYWDAGATAVEAYQFSLANNIGSSWNGIPSYNWAQFAAATNGHLVYEGTYWPSNMQDAHNFIRQQYANGKFMILSVTYGGSGHLIAVDYVDEQGNIIILDSAIRAKYLTQMDGGGVRDIKVFSSPYINSIEASHFWEGDAIGVSKNKRELQALYKELDDLQKDQGPSKSDIQVQSQQTSNEILNLVKNVADQKESQVEENIQQKLQQLGSTIQVAQPIQVNKEDEVTANIGQGVASQIDLARTGEFQYHE